MTRKSTRIDGRKRNTDNVRKINIMTDSNSLKMKQDILNGTKLLAVSRFLALSISIHHLNIVYYLHITEARWTDPL